MLVSEIGRRRALLLHRQASFCVVVPSLVSWPRSVRAVRLPLPPPLRRRRLRPLSFRTSQDWTGSFVEVELEFSTAHAVPEPFREEPVLEL